MSEDLLEEKYTQHSGNDANFSKVRHATFPSFTSPTWNMDNHDEQQYPDILERAILADSPTTIRRHYAKWTPEFQARQAPGYFDWSIAQIWHRRKNTQVNVDSK